jgi:eukaryotic-like serine/threonine-protein kinase
VSPSEPSSQRDPLDLLIEEFLHLHRKGEPVTPQVFAEQHPDFAEELLELLPTLLALEDVKRERASSGTGHSRVSLPKLDRLGDFRIEGELGRGGMGVVFEAVQESLDRRVALKVLPQASLLTGNQLERFQREAQIAARLHHSNIVPVYGSGESDGYHWYAMQYLNGQSLDRWQKDQADLVPSGSGAWRIRSRFVARMGAAAASALDYAHGLGTLHRDIKPGNFLLDQDEHLWVTDFGLAKALEAEGLTNSGDLLGTLQYMAPEQFAGTYDVRSEVYALGVTLYEMLTLKPAFRGRHRSEVMQKVQSQRFEPLARVCPDVPLDLTIIIGKAMAIEPGDRYANAQALEQDLVAFLEDRPIQARRLSTVATMWRWCRRNRTAAGLGMSAAAAVLIAAITGWIAYGVTGDALQQKTISEALAKSEGARAETNLRLSLAAFGDVFDALVGRDSAFSFDEDPETGEQTVVVQSPVSQRDVVLLRKMLAFYDEFTQENAESQSLRYETARAYRRVGAIHLRLGMPENLEEARAAFAKAMAGFDGITDLDVARDLATLHKDIGQLYERLHQEARANESFKEALVLLEQLPSAGSVAGRLEQAAVCFELHRTNHSWRGPGGPRQGRGQRRREDLKRAEMILKDLVVESPEDPDVRALQARVLMEGARSFERHDNLKQALTIWRDLVAAYPDVAEYRFALCECLLRPQSRMSRDQRLVALQEAEQSAARLFRDQPLFREARAVLLRARSRYGHDLFRASRSLAGQQKVDTEKQATVLLESALEVGQGLLEGEGRLDFRFVRHVIDTRSWLGLSLMAQKSLDGSAQPEASARAKEQALAAIDLLQTQTLKALAAVIAGRGEGLRDGRGRQRRGGNGMRGERSGEGRRGERRGMSGERERRGLLIRGPLRELVEGLDDGDVKAKAASAEAAVKAALDKVRRPR